jgi:hypothetical protein
MLTFGRGKGFGSKIKDRRSKITGWYGWNGWNGLKGYPANPPSPFMKMVGV